MFGILSVNDRFLHRSFAMQDTKERILQTALTLFARDGYEAVSVSAIADVLGITKGALYRHYENKRAIFDAIVARMEAEDAQRAAEYHVPDGTISEMEQAYRDSATESLLAFSHAQFIYWTEDPFASSFRKMLTLEQYRDPEMRRLYEGYLVSGPVGYVTDLLESWQIPDSASLALSLYAPMFFLYAAYDAAPQDKTRIHTMLDSCLTEIGRRIAVERKKRR